MSEKEKEQSDKKIEEQLKEQRKGYRDYSEKIQAPEPWPDPPDDKDDKKGKDD